MRTGTTWTDTGHRHEHGGGDVLTDKALATCRWPWAVQSTFDSFDDAQNAVRLFVANHERIRVRNAV